MKNTKSAEDDSLEDHYRAIHYPGRGKKTEADTPFHRKNEPEHIKRRLDDHDLVFEINEGEVTPFFEEVAPPLEKVTPFFVSR